MLSTVCPSVRSSITKRVNTMFLKRMNRDECTEIVHCFPGPSGVLFIWSYLVEHSSSSATALITDTRTVQVFAQGVIVCVTVTARALVTVLCYMCVLKCVYYYFFLKFFTIIIICRSVRDVSVSDENGLTYCHIFKRTVAKSFQFYQHQNLHEIPTGSPPAGVINTGGV